jgi:hypothetical protein
MPVLAIATIGISALFGAAAAVSAVRSVPAIASGTGEGVLSSVTGIFLGAAGMVLGMAGVGFGIKML